MSRDMTLFQDDDGSAYTIYSSEDNQTLSSSGEYIRIFPGKANEAPAMFKHDGRYFLITSRTAG